MTQERILCAAIYVDDGKPHARTHPYPKTGILFCGWRHADCFAGILVWSASLTPEEMQESNLRDYGRTTRYPLEPLTEAQLQAMRSSIRGFDQGFLTSTGRYVTREEAVPIAFAAGQCREGITSLISEHLY